MRLERAIMLLDAVASMKSIECGPGEREELQVLGLISTSDPPKVKGAPQKEADALRQHLAEISARKEALRSTIRERLDLSPVTVLPRRLYREYDWYKEAVDELESLSAEERKSRTRLLDLVHDLNETTYSAFLNGTPTVLTFRGNEVLITMKQRGRRIGGSDLRETIEDMDRTRAHFMWRANRASEVLKVLSPKYSEIDEIHLRNLSVGLSGHEGDVKRTVDLFVECYSRMRDLPVPTHALLPMSESIVLGSKDQKDLQDHIGRARSLITSLGGNVVSTEQALSASILVAHGADLGRHLKRMMEISVRGDLVAAALIACAESDQVERDYAAYLMESTLDTGLGDPHLAAAVLAVSGLPRDLLTERFNDAQVRFSSLGIRELVVPAAMLAVLPLDIEEGMDALRYCSHCVVSKRLSLGGFETLSLGMKLLMSSSVMSGAARDLRKGEGVSLSSLISDVPVSLALDCAHLGNVQSLTSGLNAFHEVTLHSLAVNEDQFHPTHVHSVYPVHSHFYYG